MHVSPGTARLWIGFALCWSLWVPALTSSEPKEKAEEESKSAPPLKVFVLVGQSNMLGHADVRTFEHMGMDPALQPLLERMMTAEGEPRSSERVRIAAIGGSDEERLGPLTVGYGAMGRGAKIGPELSFGFTLEDRLEGPILLIKTAWGGKSLHTDFRPPSAGPYEFREEQLAQMAQRGHVIREVQAKKVAATGRHYRMVVDYVEDILSDLRRVHPDYDPTVGHELAGLVWFQGWNDMVDSGTYPNRDEPNGYFAYSHWLAHFIRDIRRDLRVPELPVVIGVMGVGGPTEAYGPRQLRVKAAHQGFRDAMAAPAELPEFRGNVVNVYTERFWDPELKRLRELNGLAQQKTRELVQAGGELRRGEEEFVTEVFRSELLTPREREILEKGVSNGEYHYLGSAKIMAQIGRGFAEAMLELVGEGEAAE